MSLTLNWIECFHLRLTLRETRLFKTPIEGGYISQFISQTELPLTDDQRKQIHYREQLNADGELMGFTYDTNEVEKITKTVEVSKEAAAFVSDLIKQMLSQNLISGHEWASWAGPAYKKLQTYILT